jgi:TPR repeat protein
MHFLDLIALVLLAVAAGLPAHAGSAQTPTLDCRELSNVPDDGTFVPASQRIEPLQAEAACRAALKADPGNPTFMFELGRALSLGNKRLEAIKYYLDAADRGHAGAMNDLGAVFEYGIGVPKNLATAIVWYERAAELGHAEAMTKVGELSENGIGVPRDLVNARHWYEKAAALGNPTSMNDLANLLRQDGDLPAAANWYLKAAERGVASAMNSFGELSEGGMGVAQDYSVARNWYEKAADLGNADAMGNLGSLFENGQGGPQNLEIARKWYVKGASLNGRLAMRNFGAMFENGRGTSQNLSEAKVWYERAAALGYPPALNDLGRLHLAGIGVPKNYVRAKDLFEQASGLGDAKAMNNLGMLYLDGIGVQRDIKVARTWFEKAITLKNTEAQENLNLLDQAALTDDSQIADRRASCVQTCAALHRSYVSSVCERYSSGAGGGKPERSKCIGMSLTLGKQCRDTCREWAPILSPENKCVTCFRAIISCSVNQELPYNQGDERPHAMYSTECVASHAECMTNCGRQTTSSFRMAN